MTPRAWLESIILPILPKEKFALPTAEERQACIKALAQALDISTVTLSDCTDFLKALTGAHLKWDNAMLQTTALADNPLPKTGPWNGLHYRYNKIEGKPTSQANRDAYRALYNAKFGSKPARGTTDIKNGDPARPFFAAMTLMELLENRTDDHGRPAPMTMEDWLKQVFADAKVETENWPALSTLTPKQKQAIFETLRHDSFALKAVSGKMYVAALFPLIESMTRVDMWNRK